MPDREVGSSFYESGRRAALNEAGVKDFLFQGSAPVSVPTGSDTTTAFPLWLQQALFNTVGAASGLAQQPYQPFPGPTVAAPSAATTGAWDLAQSQVGGYQPFMQRAGALTESAGRPWSASDVEPFLNPYQDFVTGALNRNLTQNLLPAIQDKFVGAGQSRSPQELEITQRALRDTQGAVGESMAGAYGAAMNTAMADRTRQMQAGAQSAELGALSSRLGSIDVGQLAAAGQAQDINSQANLDAARQRFTQEQQWPYQSLGYLSDMIHSLPVQFGGYGTTTAGTAFAPSYAPSPFATFLSAAYGTGDSGGKAHGGPIYRRRGGPVLAYRNPAYRDGGAVPRPRGALTLYRMAA